MTKLSDFLTDMRDSDKVVGVKEYMLRDYARQCNEWQKLAEEQTKTISDLLAKIDKLEENIELFRIENKSLKNKQIEVIDLYA